MTDDSWEPELDPEQRHLFELLRGLREALREDAHRRYGRVNPFAEDLLDWKEKGAYVGGVDVTVYDSTTVVGDVTIGDHTWVGPFCSLDGTGGLTIGRHCSISAGTHLISHDTVRWALSGGTAAYEYAPIAIGDCTFIGAHSVVTRGVTIGEHCLVGAGSVVTRSLPPFTIAAGSPARQIGRVELADDGAVKLLYDDGSSPTL